MARSGRQSKIIEIVSTSEVETQDELALALSKLGFEITQATISRDIKELGLIKVPGVSKKSKYAFIETSEQGLSGKYISILKEILISAKIAQNLVVIKTIRGGGGLASSYMAQLNLDGFLGTTFGDEFVFIACENNEIANSIAAKINEIINE